MARGQNYVKDLPFMVDMEMQLDALQLLYLEQFMVFKMFQNKIIKYEYLQFFLNLNLYNLRILNFMMIWKILQKVYLIYDKHLLNQKRKWGRTMVNKELVYISNLFRQINLIIYQHFDNGFYQIIKQIK